MGNVAKYQHGWNMTFTVVELLMIIPKSTYLSISLPYFSIYHFFSLTLYSDEQKKRCIVHYDTPPSYLFLFLAGGKHKIAHCSLACCQHALSIQRYIHLFAIWQEQISSAIIVHFY